MAQATYQLRLKSKAGAQLAVFTQSNLLSLRVQRKINDVATHELSIDATADTRCTLFEVDGQVELWRRPAGGAWYLEYEGFHRTAHWTQDADGREVFTSSGVGYADLLRRRIIAEAARSAGATKSGAAETVAKAFVDEQIVNPTITDRRIAGVTVQADGGKGNSISIARAYRNLLEVIQEIARVGGGDFDVVGTGDAAWEFRWYDSQRGADRRASVTFATGYGNMLAPELSIEPATANVVLVMGQGQAEERAWEWRPPTNAPTGQDRIEVARDGRDTDSAATLRARGDATLAELAAVDRLRFEVLQTAGAQYGVDYRLGDLVSARYRTMNYDLKIIGVSLTMGAPDRITLEFENVR
jgi:hypothetical protein